MPRSHPAGEFADGFGARARVDDASGEPVEVLRLRPEIASASGFDFALRERVNRLANFRHAYYARVRRVDRPDSRTLHVVSDSVEGSRLSRILEVAGHFELDLDVNAALCLLRQIVPAVAMLHQNARDVSHGALSPERILITPGARVVMVEHVLGAAVESLGYSRDRLWKQLRVAAPPGAGVVRLNHRADVMQVGLVALALVLGRPLADDDLRELPALLGSATENSAMGGREPISDPLRRWLARALQLDSRGAFESALEAQLALDDVLSAEAGYVAAPVALESFLARFEEFAARMPAQAETPATPPALPPAVEVIAAPPEVLDGHGDADDPAADEPADEPGLAEQGPDAGEDEAAAAMSFVPPPPRKLGVAKISADRPAVPSFRAFVAAVPAPPEPPPADPGPPRSGPVEPLPAPAMPVDAEGMPSPPAERPVDGTLDEHSLRSHLLTDVAAPGEVALSGVAPWWRVMALVCLLAALGQGGFIWWRLASSPSGLLGTNGTLKVESKPMGAQVKIDGEVRGVTPLSVSLPAGAHVMEIVAGSEPRVIPLSITAGQTLAQYVELVGVSALGRLSIQSAPAGATVLLDGQPRGRTPLELPDVAAGDHELVLDLDGRRVRKTVTVATGITTAVDLPMAAAIEAAGMFPAAVPTTGTLLVQAPFEMQVLVGGAPKGVSGKRLTLPPGSHDVEVVSKTLGFRTTATVEIVAGETARVPVTLPTGTAHLNATPWAEVWIDGEKVGDTPIGNLSLTAGPHEIVFRHPELGERAHAATVRVGEPLRLSVDLTRQQ